MLAVGETRTPNCNKQPPQRARYVRDMDYRQDKILRTYVFLRGCTPVVPFDMPFPGPLSLVDNFSSPEPESEVEKCLDEGALARPGVLGAG